MSVRDCGSFVINGESPDLPEIAQYRILNAMHAPVVRILDVVEQGGRRFLVLEKARPLGLDTRAWADLHELLDWMICV